MSIERWILDMAPLMNVREDVQPEPRQISMEEQQPLMAALLDAQQALYRAEDAYMLGNPEGLVLGLQTALKRLQEVLG